MGFDSRLLHFSTPVKSRVSAFEKMAGIPKGIPTQVSYSKNTKGERF